MAKKVNYYSHVRVEGILNQEVSSNLTYVRDTSGDTLRLSTQNFIVPANATNLAVPIILNEDAVLTYFFLDDSLIDNTISIKLNGRNTIFNISPDFWSEEEITSFTVNNSSALKYSVSVVQLFAEVL